MTLARLPPGMRFMLCRTRQFFRHTGKWAGQKADRIVVIADDGRVASLNRQCYVKPCMVAA